MVIPSEPHRGGGRGAAPLRKWVGLSKMGKCWAQTQRAAHSWANGSAVRADLNPEGFGGCSALSQLLASRPGQWDQYSSPDSGARRQSLYAEQFENLLTARDRREWERQARTHTRPSGFQSQLITERERERENFGLIYCATPCGAERRSSACWPSEGHIVGLAPSCFLFALVSFHN